MLYERRAQSSGIDIQKEVTKIRIGGGGGGQDEELF